jgi:hypothetical protein
MDNLFHFDYVASGRPERPVNLMPPRPLSGVLPVNRLGLAPDGSDDAVLHGVQWLDLGAIGPPVGAPHQTGIE